MLNRRQFLKTITTVTVLSSTGVLTLSQSACQNRRSVPHSGQIMTATGHVAPGDLGVTLSHEHVLVDFIGADKISKDRYSRDEAFHKIRPHLKQVRRLGCQTLVECTPDYLGRDPLLLKQLSETTGVLLLTNTGYYGAADDKFIPQHAYDESPDQLAERWTSEAIHGIGDTGIHPGFMKIGVDSGPLSDIDRKLVTAAARTHKKTGLTIACHTGNGEAVLGEIETLKEEGVLGAALIWVHAQNEEDVDLYFHAAKQGVWVELDGVGTDNIDFYKERIGRMKEAGLLNRVLLSHDAGWYSVGESNGGEYRPHTPIFTHLISALEADGFTESEIHQLTTINPREAFTVRLQLA